MDYEPDLVFPRYKTGRDVAIRNMHRNGKVIDNLIDDTGVFAKVQCMDKQGMISKWIPVKQQGSRTTSDVWCPKVGDDVEVTYLPNGLNGDAFIDGSYYNTGNPPPVHDPNRKHTTFADETVMEYREGDSTYNFKSAKEATFNVDTAGPVNLKGDKGVNVKSENIVIEGDTITLKGELKFEGNIQHTGSMNTSEAHTDTNGTHRNSAELERRLAALEARLAALERGSR
ncbi:MAG TPA: phage baseplate assembly protein V [Bacteroidia bacterium]|jgi:phage baseplate assembly protein V|nr:phage baseplate assembly protein V [Bacteroidia bacterium]